MLTKTLVAALVLASASLVLTSNVNAGPIKYPTQAELNWMDRASQVTDSGAQ